MLSFIWVKMRTTTQDSTSDSCEKLLQRGSWGWFVYMWFWWRGGTWNQAFFFFFWRRFLLVTRSSHQHEGFNAFLNLRRYRNRAHKTSSWKYTTIWRSALPAPCPPNTECLFCPPPWTPFRKCWKSATKAAHDLILEYVDGKYLCKCQFAVDTINSIHLNIVIRNTFPWR